jgi:hypothetical protein
MAPQWQRSAPDGAEQAAVREVSYASCRIKLGGWQEQARRRQAAMATVLSSACVGLASVGTQLQLRDLRKKRKSWIVSRRCG